jgi:hypothetical protein
MGDEEPCGGAADGSLEVLSETQALFLSHLSVLGVKSDVPCSWRAWTYVDFRGYAHVEAGGGAADPTLRGDAAPLSRLTRTSRCDSISR